MISSPCKTCEKRYLPKDLCADTCERLKKVQNLNRSMADEPYKAVDCTDGNRYGICLPVTTMHQPAF